MRDKHLRLQANFEKHLSISAASYLPDTNISP